MGRPRRRQPLLIRITHWLNVPALAVMGMSGLQILSAYPWFGPRGATYEWVPLSGWESPAWLRAGQWLAGARHLHFAMAWLLVINAIGYLSYLAWSGEWRRRLFWPPRDTRPAIQQALHYVRLRKQPPAPAFYNGLQRFAYTAALALAVVAVASGLAIWKPVQLHWLAWPMGGYDGARVAHWLALLGLVAFTIVHVALVLVHPRTFADMVSGGARELVPAEPAAAEKPAEKPAGKPAPAETPAPAEKPAEPAAEKPAEPEPDEKPTKPEEPAP